MLYSHSERNGASAKIAEANLRIAITTTGWGSSCSDVNDQRNIFFAATIAHTAWLPDDLQRLELSKLVNTLRYVQLQSSSTV